MSREPKQLYHIVTRRDCDEHAERYYITVEGMTPIDGENIGLANVIQCVKDLMSADNTHIDVVLDTNGRIVHEVEMKRVWGRRPGDNWIQQWDGADEP